MDYDGLLKVVQYLTADYGQLKEGFKRVVFNVIGKNCDDHSKNVSFLMDSAGEWRLAPAYDLVYSYSKTEFYQHYLKVNGKSSGITLDDLIALGVKYDLSSRFVKDEVEKCIGSFCKFEHFAKEVNLSSQTSALILENVLSKSELVVSRHRANAVG